MVVAHKKIMATSPSSPVRWFESSDSEPPRAASSNPSTPVDIQRHQEEKEGRGWYDMSSSDSEKVAQQILSARSTTLARSEAFARAERSKATRTLVMGVAEGKVSGAEDQPHGPSQPGKKRKGKRRRPAAGFLSLYPVLSTKQYLMRDKRIQLFESSLHGVGIVASETIDPDTQLCPYLGTIIPNSDIIHDSVYTYGISFSGGIIDSYKHRENHTTLQACFFNTCHPALPAPFNKANVYFEEVSVRSRKGRIVPRIIARAAEAILPGVEALADYHWLLTASDPSKYTCLCSECLEFVV